MFHLKYVHRIFPLEMLIKLTSQKLILPFYHTISNHRLPHISNLYTIKNIRQFEDDLDFLCKHYQPISINELENYIYNEEKIGKPKFHLTFDDGLKEIYTEIAPILERKGIPATIFINTDFIDNGELFYRYKVSLLIEKIRNDQPNAVLKISNRWKLKECNFQEIEKKLLSFNINNVTEIDEIARLIQVDFTEFLKTEQPYLTENQIEQLIKRGFAFGSHSLNHPFFKDINPSERKRQITESFKFIEQIFSINCSYFSFPFSDEAIDRQFLLWLHNNANCRLSFGISGMKRDCTKFHLHRIPFEHTLPKACDIIKKEYLYYIIKFFFNKNKILRK